MIPEPGRALTDLATRLLLTLAPPPTTFAAADSMLVRQLMLSQEFEGAIATRMQDIDDLRAPSERHKFDWRDDMKHIRMLVCSLIFPGVCLGADNCTKSRFQHRAPRAFMPLVSGVEFIHRRNYQSAGCSMYLRTLHGGWEQGHKRPGGADRRHSRTGVRSYFHLPSR